MNAQNGIPPEPGESRNEPVEQPSPDDETDIGEVRSGVAPADAASDDDLPNHDADGSKGAEGTATLDELGKARRWGPYRRWISYRWTRKHDATFWRERDASENAEGRLPDEEHLEIPAVWIVELYTPSTIPGLLEGLRRLGWEVGKSRDDSLVKWMSEVRTGRLAGWTSLGLVSSPKSPHLMTERTALLPPGVDAAFPSLMSVTPSLSALAICFVMGDESARALNAVLRGTYSTFAEPLFKHREVVPYVLWNRPIRLGHRIHSPDFQRRDGAVRVLDDLERRCSSWVSRNLPGVFGSDLRGGLYPSSMFFVSEQTMPLTDEASKIRAMEGPALDRSYEAWRSDEWPGVRTALPHSWRSEGLRLQFGCRRRDAFPDRSGYPDEDSNWTMAQRANDYVPGLSVRWALTCLLDGYHQALSNLRDQSAKADSYRPVRDLKRLRRLVRTDVYDILLSASEIATFAEDKWRYAHNVIELEQASLRSGEKIELLEQLRSSQISRSRQVENEAGLLLSTLAASTDMTQTISNVRVQRALTVLTVLSIVVAIAALVVAATGQN
jgi:hypothetical protein